MDQATRAYPQPPTYPVGASPSAAGAATDATAIHSILVRLANLYATLESANDRYQRVCDRAFGSRPEAASNPNKDPGPSGLLDVLGQHLSNLEQQAQSLHAIADRIDTII